MWAHVVTLGAGAIAGTGSTLTSAPSFDGARAELDVTALPTLHLSADWRYFAGRVVDFDTVLDRLAAINGSQHMSAATSYDLFSWLSFGAVGGAGYDVLEDSWRGYAGPTLALPEAFGSLGGVDFGALAELGGFPGRSGYVTFRLAPVAPLQVATRVSYFDTDALDDAYREVGLMTWIDAPILPWLGIRGSLYGQQAIPTLRGFPRATPSLLQGDLAVTGTL
jgi:hypothetical protein